MAIICALIIAVLAGPLLLFQTKEMWNMTSSNAQSWNATLNTSATFGINIIPIIIIVIVITAIALLVSVMRGF